MANRFTKEQYSPALFDVARDIIGTLPVKLVEKWLATGQDHADALRLLEPYKVKGHSVSSDSAGLTKLTRQKSLLEILAIINQPKEIVHGIGTAMGGQAVGIWAADNTQMFYPSSVDPVALLAALLTIQDMVKKNCHLSIGLGAHFGEFYSISGGLYGPEADAIEEVAENETEGGEVVISQAIAELLPPSHSFTLVKRSDKPTAIGDLFRVVDGPRLPGVTPSNTKYPIPYSDRFYSDLVAFENRLTDTAFGRELAEKYTQNKVIVLIEREGQDAETPEIALFNNLARSAMMKDVGMQLLSTSNGKEVKVVGPLGIYAFDDAAAALRFAQRFRENLARAGISCRIGIDSGPVLVFDLAVGGSDIAGNPVNIASKMAQDKGKPGKLYLSSTMQDYVDVSGFAEITYTVSGVAVTAYEG